MNTQLTIDDVLQFLQQSCDGKYIGIANELPDNIHQLNIYANQAGLAYMAWKFLMLSQKSPEVGAHLHFDEFGTVQPCDIPMVISLAPEVFRSDGPPEIQKISKI